MLTARTSLGIVFFPAYDWAISPTHPEREERLLYTQDQFREEGLFDISGISEHRPLRAKDEDILVKRNDWAVFLGIPNVEDLITSGLQEPRGKLPAYLRIGLLCSFHPFLPFLRPFIRPHTLDAAPIRPFQIRKGSRAGEP